MTALSNRLASLEKARPTKPKNWITCFPYDPSWHGANCHQHVEEIAPGILLLESRYRPGNREIAYHDRAALDQWLGLPDQANDLKCVYRIFTPEFIAATLAKVESEI